MAVRPKDAASLVLVCHDGGARRFLMGQRSPRLSFMPGLWVFPGGRVERSDYRAPGEFDPHLQAALAATARLKRQNGPRLAQALVAAALREAHEETGLKLASGQALSYLARAITPPFFERRFDTRFLLAVLPSPPAVSASSELAPVRWLSAAECSDLPLHPITRAVLAAARQLLDGELERPPFWRWPALRPTLPPETIPQESARLGFSHSRA